MTNQMKKILKISAILSIITFGVMIAALFNGGFGYDNVFSYVCLAVSASLAIILTIFYLVIEFRDNKYRNRIYSAKKLLELRDGALLDFYKKYNLKPQYNEKGALVTPDELLEIVIKKTEDGTPEATIYEILGIEPVIDENGKEVPVILVLKHLIKKVRTEKLKEIKKLNGLYLKGSKKEKSKEIKKEPKNAKKEGEKSGKSKGSKKPEFGIRLEQKEYKPDKKGSKKKEESKKTEHKEEKPEPKVEQIKKEEIKEVKAAEKKAPEPQKSSYYEKMFKSQNQSNKNAGARAHEDVGEFTIE